MIAASSSGPEYLKPIRCLAISAKYSLASFDVLVPKPAETVLLILITPCLNQVAVQRNILLYLVSMMQRINVQHEDDLLKTYITLK